MCITLNVYIDSYIVQHHSISQYKYGAISINKHLHICVYKYLRTSLRTRVTKHVTRYGHARLYHIPVIYM